MMAGKRQNGKVPKPDKGVGPTPSDHVAEAVPLPDPERTQPEQPTPSVHVPEGVAVTLKRPVAIGNGDRPAGFQLGIITMAPDVTIQEWLTAFHNPDMLSFRDG